MTSPGGLIAQSEAPDDIELLQGVATLSGVGGWRLELGSGVLTWSARTRAIHQVSADYNPTLDAALAFYAPEARPVITAAVDRCITGNVGWDLEAPLITASGQRIWVRTMGRTIRATGKPQRVIGSIEDITGRKEAEQNTLRSEALLRATLDNLSEGVIVLDRDGTILSANPAAARLLGGKARSLAGWTVTDIDETFHFENEAGQPITNPLMSAARYPSDVGKLVIRLANTARSRALWLELTATPLLAAGSELFEQVVVSINDISQTKWQAETLQATFDNFPGGVVRYDKDHIMRGYNEELKRLLKYPEFLFAEPRHLTTYLTYSAKRGDYGPGDPVRLAQQRYEEMTCGKPHAYERVRPDGTTLEVRGTPLPDGGLVATVTDISDRKRIEQELADQVRLARDKSEELQIILASMSQGVSVFDSAHRLTLWNRQYLHIFGKPLGEVTSGVTLSELIRAEQARGEFDGDVDAHVAALQSQLAKGKVVTSLFHHPNGKVISSVHTPLPGGGWIGTHEDVTLREQAAEKIAHAAHHDMLTGLANRSLFNQKLAGALANVVNGGASAVLLLLDLDRFKPVNDTYGHSAGDALLKQVGDRLKACVRATDLVARFGGDEFGIILPDMQCRQRVAEIAEALVRQVRAPFRHEEHVIEIGVSIGIDAIRPGDTDISSVLNRADLALYEVKNGGRNDYRFYSGPDGPSALSA